MLAYVPGKQYQHRANGLFPDEPLEPSLRFAGRVRQTLSTDFEEVLPPRYCCGDLLARVGYRATHLLRDLSRERILSRRYQLQGFLDGSLALR